MRSDIGELSSTLGLPGSSAKLGSCCLCEGRLPAMVQFPKMAAKPRSPFKLHPDNLYEDTLSECERVVLTDAWTEEDWQELLSALHESKQGKGMCLSRTVGDLLKGWRLEPSDLLPDMGALTVLGIAGTAAAHPIVGSYPLADVRPKCLTFWSRNNETLTRRKNPLFTGCLKLSKVLCVDGMHTFALGIAQQFVGHFFQHAFACNVCKHPGTQVLDRDTANARYMDSVLQEWKRARNTHRIAKGEVRPEAFGSRQKPACHFKASGVIALLYWLADKEYGICAFQKRLIRAEVWQRAAGNLAELWEAFQSRQWQPPKQFIENEWVLWLEYLENMPAMGMSMLPKHHWMAHLMERSSKIQNQPQP
eukprot:6468125-Amphidinium_carterae.1